MSVRLLVATRSDVGRVRPGNEDAVAVDDEIRLVAVADGMGGHQAGEVASQTAITELLAGIERGDPIETAITSANDAVFAKASEDLSLRGMGTTLTAGVVDDATLLIGHVGDSRAYLLRDGGLDQLTRDHSVIAELVAAGELTEDQALVDPRRSMITRALGIDAAVAVDVLTVDLRPGDRLLLCSDGLTTMVRDDVIAAILSEELDRERAADALVEAANEAGGADNITVVVADVVSDDDFEHADPDMSAPASTDFEVDADLQADTDEVPVVPTSADGGEESGPFEVAETPEVDLAPDDDLAKLRAAVEETAPKRRWWRRS